MSMESAARRALDLAKARYEAEGYIVTINDALFPLEGLRADAVARRKGEAVVIEVRSADLSDRAKERLQRLAQLVDTQPGWRVDIVTYEPERTPPYPDHQDVVRRVEEARRLTEVSPDAAVLLIWSAVEGALLRLSRQRGLDLVRLLPPRTLIRRLSVDGVLSDNQAAELDSFAVIRNNIAHGQRSELLRQDQFDWLARFAVAAADGEVANVEDMIEWFLAHYTTPEDAALFYDKEEGDYVWAGAGPYHPTEILQDQFDTALDSDIADAVQVISQHGFDWAKHEES